MKKQKALITVSILLAAFTALTTAPVTITEGNSFELVDINSTITLEDNFTFDTYTVYGDNLSIEGYNISITSNTTKQINSSLYSYNLSNPQPGTVLKLRTNVSSGTNVQYYAEANYTGTGSFKLYKDGSQIKTFSSDTLAWSEDSWSTHNFTATYQTGAGSVTLEWQDNSDNEDGFRVYSNATGTMKQRKTVSANSGTGTVSTTESTSLDSGETIEFQVKAYNQYGSSTPATTKATIP